MKVLWICNMTPGVVQQKRTGESSSGLWVDHMIQDLRATEHRLHILFPGSGASGTVNEKVSFAPFPAGPAQCRSRYR